MKNVAPLHSGIALRSGARGVAARARAILPARAGLLASAMMLASASSFAQSTVSGVPNALQGFSQNRDKPIQIDAASLEMRDKDKAATFSGNVKVTQGDTTMRSKTLVVFYDRQDKDGSTAPKAVIKSATPGPSGSSSISRLEAKGGVTVTQKDQTVTGETGIFDMRSNTVTMVGGVVLTKDKNVLRGDRLVVDMTTGVSRVESGSGRVQGLFQSSAPGGTPGGGLIPGSGAAAPARDGNAASPGKPTKLNSLPETGKRGG